MSRLESLGSLEVHLLHFEDLFLVEREGLLDYRNYSDLMGLLVEILNPNSKLVVIEGKEDDFHVVDRGNGEESRFLLNSLARELKVVQERLLEIGLNFAPDAADGKFHSSAIILSFDAIVQQKIPIDAMVVVVIELPIEELSYDVVGTLAII